MTRRLGAEAYLYRILSSGVDHDTGMKTVETERMHIRNALRADETVARSVIYTASQMQAIRSSAWQGSGQEVAKTTFMIYIADMKDWGAIEPDQWIRYNDVNYQIVDALETAGGWILQCKVALGSGPAENND
jgi:hypothetical protein